MSTYVQVSPGMDANERFVTGLASSIGYQ